MPSYRVCGDNEPVPGETDFDVAVDVDVEVFDEAGSGVPAWKPGQR
jgi:hypothetical protein